MQVSPQQRVAAGRGGGAPRARAPTVKRAVDCWVVLLRRCRASCKVVVLLRCRFKRAHPGAMLLRCRAKRARRREGVDEGREGVDGGEVREAREPGHLHVPRGARLVRGDISALPKDLQVIF